MPLKRLQERRQTFEHTDFRLGLIGNISGDIRSERLREHRYFRHCDNLRPTPYGSLKVRGGSRDISSATCPLDPHSLGKWKPTAATGKLFVGTRFNPSLGDLYEVTPSAYTRQTLPITLNDEWIKFEQLNEAIFATQIGNAAKPIFYEAGNPANNWHSMVLPKPVAPGDNIGFAADSAPGNLTTGVTYYYRVRWRYRNGSSLAGPVSAGRPVTTPNLTVNINAGLVPSSPRSDYLGWTLERTKQGGTSAGPFYWVADGTAGTYADGIADADLGYEADDDIHGDPPAMDGFVAYKDRLIGWKGTRVYVSQAIGDAEATGICNWDAELEYRTDEEGDEIKLCVAASDHVLILMRHSLHVLDGDDPDSFRLYRIASGVGAAGPRCARLVGGVVHGLGDRGFFRVRGRSVELMGRNEVGHFINDVNPADLPKSVLGDEFGDTMIAALPLNAAYNDEAVCLEMETKAWWHIDGWAMADMLSQKDREFSTAHFIFADPTNRATAFPAFAGGEAVSGTSIPGGTLMVSSPAGDEITMDTNAAGDQDNVTVTIGGTPYTGCQIRNGSPTIRRGSFRVWVGFDGTKDERTSVGGGGNAIAIEFETHPLDEGYPDDLKEVEWIKAFATSSGFDLAGTVIAQPGNYSASVPLGASAVGALWGGFTWGDGTIWGSANKAEPSSGIPFGIIGTAYIFRLTGTLDRDFIWEGFVASLLILPDRRLSA